MVEATLQVELPSERILGTEMGSVQFVEGLYVPGISGRGLLALDGPELQPRPEGRDRHPLYHK